MRTWRSRLYLPVDYREQDALSKEANPEVTLWPNCMKCSKAHRRPVTVTSYGVKDFGKLPGRDGEHYTDFYATCHGEEDIIRIEGFRWDRSNQDEGDDQAARLAAIKALPFFHSGSEVGRCIPANVMRNFFAAQRGSSM